MQWKEKEFHLPVLGTDIYRRTDGTLGYKIYRKATHTHTQIFICMQLPVTAHPINKQYFIHLHRAKTICDDDIFRHELDVLSNVFKDNGYSNKQIHKALNYKSKHIRQVEKPSAVAVLPYIQSTYGRLNRFLARYDIKSVGLPHKKSFIFFVRLRMT